MKDIISSQPPAFTYNECIHCHKLPVVVYLQPPGGCLAFFRMRMRLHKGCFFFFFSSFPFGAYIFQCRVYGHVGVEWWVCMNVYVVKMNKI